MENQTLSIQQMRHLKELGVDTSKASMGWTYVQSKAYPTMKTDASLIIGVDADKMMEDSEYETVLIPAFTLQDIIELLPDEIKVGTEWGELSVNNIRVAYMVDLDHDGSYPCKKFEALNGENEESVLELCYQMLCWCAENGYLNNNKTE